MQSINIHDAKTRLSSILADVEKGTETYVICRNGKAIADLVPHKKSSRVKQDPFLSQVKINCDLTAPMTEKEWDLE